MTWGTSRRGRKVWRVNSLELLIAGFRVALIGQRAIYVITQYANERLGKLTDQALGAQPATEFSHSNAYACGGRKLAELATCSDGTFERVRGYPIS